MVVASPSLHPVLDLLDRLTSTGETQGAAIAVAVNGEPVAEHVVGWAREGTPATSQTLWPLASISKVYTAATVMALVERGVLTLGTTVRGVLPAFDGDGRERITVRHLLTHTSGLIYESPAMEQHLLAQTPLDALVDEVDRHPLLFPPGTALSYSDLGFAVLGQIATVATGTPFPDLVRRLVIEPGGLRETFMPPPPEEDDRLAYVSGAAAEGTAGAMHNSRYARDLAHPAFGAVATVGDLLRFGLLFGRRGGRILSEATVRTMTTDQTDGHVPAFAGDPTTGAPHPWGLGLMLKGRLAYPELLSPAAFGHDGATGCALWIDPTHGVAIAFASNRHYGADPTGFEVRLNRILNVAVACLTRQH
jgi:CubicO group peptidase (beta-lactamase class C family)